jgi:hypothetical protein
LLVYAQVYLVLTTGRASPQKSPVLAFSAFMREEGTGVPLPPRHYGRFMHLHAYGTVEDMKGKGLGPMVAAPGFKNARDSGVRHAFLSLFMMRHDPISNTHA